MCLKYMRAARKKVGQAGGGRDMFADLHCHTQLSDGSVAVQDLIDMACKRAVSYTHLDVYKRQEISACYTVPGRRKRAGGYPGTEGYAKRRYGSGKRGMPLCP